MAVQHRWYLRFCAAALVALPLGACGSSTSLLDMGPQAAQPQPLANASARPISRLIAFKPAAGPPDDVNLELSRQLNDAAIDQGIALVSDTNVKSEYSLRGYITALRKGSTVNLTYLWDVLDARGQRVTRLEGEEALTDSYDGKTPWSSVTPAVSRAVAQRAIGDLSKWLKANPNGAGVAMGQSVPPPSGLSAPPPGGPQRVLSAAQRSSILDD